MGRQRSPEVAVQPAARRKNARDAAQGDVPVGKRRRASIFEGRQFEVRKVRNVLLVRRPPAYAKMTLQQFVNGIERSPRPAPVEQEPVADRANDPLLFAERGDGFLRRHGRPDEDRRRVARVFEFGTNLEWRAGDPFEVLDEFTGGGLLGRGCLVGQVDRDPGGSGRRQLQCRDLDAPDRPDRSCQQGREKETAFHHESGS